MPIKFTWKGLLGLVMVVAGYIPALVAHASSFPKPVGAAIASAGAILVAVDRVMDAIDYRTDSLAKKVTTVVAPTGTTTTTTVPMVTVQSAATPDVSNAAVAPMPAPFAVKFVPSPVAGTVVPNTEAPPPP